MLPQYFHPVLQRWWETRFGEPGGARVLPPTEAQLEGWRLERGDLPGVVRVICVWPLKALSADIHKNLAEPRREIRRIAEEMGFPAVGVTAAVRSGDTPQGERAAMLRTPPHILVTTPESLYLLLTAGRSREMLKTARVAIVDEIHAVLESRRGAHLALSLERLDPACGRRLHRVGRSATPKRSEEGTPYLVVP